MSRRHFYWDREAHDWVEYVPQRRKSMGPAIISDTLDGVRNPVDGRVYDSKSRYYDAVKQAGCEIVGNDSSFTQPKMPEYKPEGVGRDIARAIEQLGG
jgi:hypothetical protein